MKKYWKQIVGALILILVLIAIGKAINRGVVMERHDSMDDKMTDVRGTIHGSVTATYEGEHTLNYKLVLAPNATTTLEMSNRLLKVSSASTTKPLYYYFSYEGGRGYDATDYISNVLGKSVKIVKIESMTHGDNIWTVARSANSSWHIATFGEWLLVIENSNIDKDIATASISSFKIENAKENANSYATTTNMNNNMHKKDIMTSSTTASTTHDMY